MARIAFVGLSALVASLFIFSVGGAQTATTTPTPTPTPTSPATVAPAAPATVALLPPTAAPTETAARDEAEFDRLRDEALRRPLVYGPADGSLAMDEQNIALATADVTVRDFAVHVTFTNPVSASEHGWDYGLVFRLTDTRAYQLGVHSAGDWFLAVDTAQPDQSGSLTTLNLSANGTNSLDLIALEDRGLFGVNGRYVATLDLSANLDAGRLAVAAPFFGDSAIAGGATRYEDFIVWSFDEEAATPEANGAGTPTPRFATATPAATVPPRPTVAPAEEASPIATTRYTSPTYGYSLTWNDDWAEVTQGSQDDYDLLRIASDEAIVDLSGFPWSGTAEDCIDGLVDYYQGQSGYSDVRIAVDEAGNERRGRDGATAWAVIESSLTSDGATDAYANYVECRPIVVGESMLSIEYLTYAADFEAQESERERMLADLTVPGEGETGTPVVTPEATAGFALGPIGLTLDEQNGSGVSGLATLAEATAKDGETVVKVLVAEAPPGAVALIHAGTCAELDPAPAFLLSPIDENGASATTIRASLRDLRVMDEYAIAIYTSVGDLSQPIACGEIPTAG
ncbi:MAG: eukaryotic-like serine/threonine-protein kinase [Thermomicrobiales bacterium]|nr:eukaryotic-like serine/threonine-protein kinase [Thermomicrobiales bacterium]